MSKPQATRHLLVRLTSLGISGLLAWWLIAPGPAPVALSAALGFQGLALLCGLLLASKHYTRTARLSFLATDLACLGCVAYLALLGQAESSAHILPFLTAYIVSTLVAVVGGRPSASVLGGLAGLMVLGMGLLFMQTPGSVLTATFVIPQVIWVALAAGLASIISIHVQRQADWLNLSRTVQRELRSREEEAAELVSLTEALSDSACVEELAEAVLRHVRCHLTVRARAIALESDGEELAIWEETGRIEQDHLERRRVVLQKALARNGSIANIVQLKARSLGNQEVPARLDYQTVVDIPIRVGGRVAGVIYLADPKRGALPQDRIGMLADIARRTGEAIGRFERRKVHENRRTSLLLRQMREGVFLLSQDGAVLLANPAARSALSASHAATGHDTLGETPLAELGRTPPGISRRFRVQVAGEDTDHPRELACTAVGIIDKGQRVGTLVTVADITDEELARRRLMQAEKSTLVGQTLAGVAHELNNPLAALIGYADLLKLQKIPPGIEKPVRQIREQATRATRIVRNLLNFARRKNPQRTPTRLTDLVDATVELFAYEARMGNIELTVEMEEDLPSIIADKHSIQQILVNLVQNSLHALAKWEGERSLTITGRTLADSVVLRIRDTGPGVPAELRAKVFQPFFTTKGSANGTGLGLALAVSIAREHGGDLILEPDDGTGACFVLRLPTPARAAAKASAQSGGKRLAMPACILVVDDEPSVRESLVAQLGNLGSRVDSAANSTEAQRMLGHIAYDAILLDVRMPGTSGLDLHQAILARNPSLARRVVFMTGDFVNDGILNEVDKTGNLLLEKPFTMDELAEALDETTQQGNSTKPSPGVTATN